MNTVKFVLQSNRLIIHEHSNICPSVSLLMLCSIQKFKKLRTGYVKNTTLDTLWFLALYLVHVTYKLYLPWTLIRNLGCSPDLTVILDHIVLMNTIHMMFSLGILLSLLYTGLCKYFLLWQDNRMIIVHVKNYIYLKLGNWII